MTVYLSVYLDAIRFAAALMVFLGHLKYGSGWRLPIASDYAEEAVLVFFVLSGLVISHSTNRRPMGASDFAIARLARLWSVSLAALLVTLLADTAGQWLSLAAYGPLQPYSLFKWLISIPANASFLSQCWNAQITPGTNAPFWSLSYEFFYYALFGAWYFWRGRVRAIVIVALMAVAGPAILIAMPVWIIGAALDTWLRRYGNPGRTLGWIAWLGSVAFLAVYTIFGATAWLRHSFPAAAAYTEHHALTAVAFWPASYLIGAAVAVNIYGFSGIGDVFGRFIRSAGPSIRRMSDATFGLYLFHYPLMWFCKAGLFSVGLKDGPAFVVIMYAATFSVSVYLALWCEDHRGQFTRWLSRGLGRLAVVAP